MPLHERLHTEARERQAARGLAQHHLEQEALRECTFQVKFLHFVALSGGWSGREGCFIGLLVLVIPLSMSEVDVAAKRRLICLCMFFFNS